MRISDLTTAEGIAVHHALEMLRIATQADFPMEPETKLVLLKNLITPDVLSAIAKLEFHLDSLRQIREMAVGFNASASVTESSKTGGERG